MGLLDGKVVVVTGGGHGIGRAYCLGIAREGGTAVVADIDEQAAQGVTKAIQDSGGKALATQVDVANFASCRDMAGKTLDAYGKIDADQQRGDFGRLPAKKGSWQDITEEAWDRMMAGTSRARLASRARCRHAAAPSRSVVNISRIWRPAAAAMMHYVTSKAAVIWVQPRAANGSDNIRVFTTTRRDHVRGKPRRRPKNYERSASEILKRIEQPEDLVGLALYLLSDLSAFVTGQTILVNGGAVLHCWRHVMGWINAAPGNGRKSDLGLSDASGENSGRSFLPRTTVRKCTG
jgi:3-oxoacyl-[acyl-carrier protein] reductase